VLTIGAVGLSLPGLARAFEPEVNYQLQCMGCHRRDGSGQPGRVPSVRRTLVPMSCLPQGRDFVMRVPGVAQAPLSDVDLAALLNWMMRHVSDAGVSGSPRDYSAVEVHGARSHPLADVKIARARVLRLLGSRTDRQAQPL
jgi:hypothetical protein